MNKRESIQDTIRIYKQAMTQCKDDINAIHYYISKINQLTRQLIRLKKNSNE